MRVYHVSRANSSKAAVGACFVMFLLLFASDFRCSTALPLFLAQPEGSPFSKLTFHHYLRDCWPILIGIESSLLLVPFPKSINCSLDDEGRPRLVIRGRWTRVRLPTEFPRVYSPTYRVSDNERSRLPLLSETMQRIFVFLSWIILSLISKTCKRSLEW